MPSVVQTGFVSKEQEEYLKKNDPALYKQVLKKHGSYREKKVESIKKSTHTKIFDLRGVNKRVK